MATSVTEYFKSWIEANTNELESPEDDTITVIGDYKFTNLYVKKIGTTEKNVKNDLRKFGLDVDDLTEHQVEITITFNKVEPV